MKIAFIPIDNRPVCYTLPKLLAGIDKNIDFSIPDRKYLGDLKKIADKNYLIDWLEKLEKQDAIIISLDTLIYGGLIPSRRSTQTLDAIEKDLDIVKNILKRKNSKIYAFSSIMRISNNNYNEEEKEYWSQYGEKIFKYSYDLHKNGKAQTDVPTDILKDYLDTRKRNFEVNKIFLHWQKEGIFDNLIFSKDDCAQFGLNVLEAQELEKLGAYIKTGADEIPLSLLSRAIEKDLKICPIFLEPEYKNSISNYEDISVEKSVTGQIELAGCRVTGREEADIILYVNNFVDKQGEIVMKQQTKMFDKQFEVPSKPFMVADVRFANGSDNNFISELFKNKLEDKNFYGYSAWNTTANTLGSLICGAKIKFAAKQYNKDNFIKLQITRFLDDWGYQANVRQQLKIMDIEKLKIFMKLYENKVSKILDTNVNVKYSFPWERLFEVEIWV